MAMLRGHFKVEAVAIAFIALIGVMYCPALSDGVSYETAEECDTIVIGFTQEPDTLNPFRMVLSISYTINYLVYDTLTSPDEDLNLGPRLATSWESSPDNLTWTFHLVEDAVWHDGENVTSDDVKFTFDMIMDNPNEGALWIDYLMGVEEILAPDPYTVQIITAEPKATMLSIMIPILPEHIWSHIPPSIIDNVDPWDPTYFPDGPIGSGPFILDSWESILGEILLLKNTDYFMGTVNVDEVLFKIYGNEASMMNALYSETLDVATGVPASLWETTLERAGIEGQEVSSASFFELGINCATEEWREAFPQASENLETTNLSVRQAIAMATNKDFIVSDILEGHAEPGVSIIPKATEFWFYNLSEEDKWDYQINAANDLLDAAGYADIDDDGTRENESSSVELEFHLHYRKDYIDEEKAAENISTSLWLIGIDVILEPVSEGVLWNDWMNCKYDLFIWGWDCDIDPDFMLSTMTTAQQPVDPQDTTKWGDAFWCSDVYDQMYLDQQGAVNVTERQAIIHDMQAMLYEQCPYVVLYYPMGLYAYHETNFENFPDMESHPGLVPEYSWFYFEITPVGVGPTNPPPVTTAILTGTNGAEGWYISDVEVLLESTSIAGVDQTLYSLDGGDWLTYDGEFTVSDDGIHTLEYYSIDLNGTSEDPREATFSIDTNAPLTSASIVGTEGEDGWYRSIVNVTIESADATSGVDSTVYSYDGSVWEVYEETIAISEDGNHSILFQSTDLAGNEEEIGSVAFQIDRTAPVLSIISPLSGSATSNATVQWECTEDNEIISIELAVDSSDYELYEGEGDDSLYTHTFSIAEGVHEISIRITDIAGNSAVDDVSFILDWTNPVITVVSPSDDSKISEDRITVAWNGTDVVSGIDHYEVQIDGGVWLDVGDATSHTWENLDDGWHTISVRAVDESGNAAESSVDFGVYTSIWSQNGPYDGIPLYVLVGGLIALAAIAFALIRGRLGGATPSKAPDDEDSV